MTQPLGPNEIGRGRGESEDSRILATLESEFHAPARRFRGGLPEVPSGHVQNGLVDFVGRSTASKQMI